MTTFTYGTTISSFIATAIVLTAIYLNGVLYFFHDYEKDRCEVTYMFEYPQYVRISNKADDIYPKYELYAYSEGRFTERAREMYFDGIPILFIPGNAGSHRQVRSLSSVALRKAINSRTNFHFDYFSVNLNKENSALTGTFLFDQLNYVNASINRILQLYKERKNPPKSVAVIGHSMGGIVAKRLAALQPNLIRIVLLLAGPIRRALYLLDHHMETFYKTLPSVTLVNSTTLISLSGGFSDQMLIPSLYQLREDDSNALSIVTSKIPMSWLQANHVQILWCKQTVLAINRAFFDSVDTRTGQISDNNDVRLAAFKHNLVRNSGIQFHERSSYELSARFEYHKAEWIELIERQKSIFHRMGVNRPIYYMVKLSHFNEHEMLTLLGLNLDIVDWVYACGAHVATRTYRACAQGRHLTQFSEIAPSRMYKRRVLQMNMHDLMASSTNLTHIVFRALPTTEPLVFHADVYADSARTVVGSLPTWAYWRRVTVIDKTALKALHYKVILPDLQHIVQSYTLNIYPMECVEQQHHAVATLVVPWSHEDTHAYITEKAYEPLILRLYNSKPPNSEYESPYVRLTLDPTCRYHISAKILYDGVLGQIARNYSYLLLAFIAAVILMTFRMQLQTLARPNGECPSFFVAIKEGAKPYYVLTGFKLLSRSLSHPFFLRFLPEPDWKFLVDDGTDFLVLPLILYITCIGIVYCLVIAFYISLILLESSVNKVALRFLAKSISFAFSFTDQLMPAIQKFSCIVAGFLVFLSLTTCGSLALCVGAFFYFLRLTQMSQEFYEQIIGVIVNYFTQKSKRNKRSETPQLYDNLGEIRNPMLNDVNESVEQNDGEEEEIMPKIFGHSEISFHSTIFFMWIIVTVLNIPAVITWAHNYHESKSLTNDTSLIPGLVLSLCAFPLWQMKLPRANLIGYERLSQIMWASAVIVLIYSPISLFRLNYFLAIVVALVTLHQLFAPGVVEMDDDGKDAGTKYDEAKAKMD